MSHLTVAQFMMSKALSYLPYRNERKQSQIPLVRTPARQKLFIEAEKILHHQVQIVLPLSCEEDGGYLGFRKRGDAEESQEVYTCICEVTHSEGAGGHGAHLYPGKRGF